MEAHCILRLDDWAGVRRAAVGIDPGLTRSGVGVVVELGAPAGPEPDFGASRSAKELNRQRLVHTGRRLRVQEAWTVGHPPLPKAPEAALPGEWRSAGTQPNWQRIAELTRWYDRWLHELVQRHPGVEWTLVLETATATRLHVNSDALGALNGAVVACALRCGIPPDRVFTASGSSKYTLATYALFGQTKPRRMPAKRKERKPYGARILLEHARVTGRALDLDPGRELHWDGADACLLAAQAWSCHGTYDPPAAVVRELEERAGAPVLGKRKRAFRDDIPLAYQLW